MAIGLQNNYNLGMGSFTDKGNMPQQTQSSDYIMKDLVGRSNDTFLSLVNELKGMSAKYNEQMDKFSTQYEGLMNDLLAKKNKYTGNIFKDFITDYKDARESGIGSGVRDSIMGLFGGNKQPNISPDSFAPEYQFSNQSPEYIDSGMSAPEKLFDPFNFGNWKRR